jgi:hypothetical protein
MSTAKKPVRKASRKKAAKSTRAKKSEVWDRPAPKKSKHTHLGPKAKAKAKASAKRAGRHYPNMVDNIRAAAKQKKSTR